MPNFPFLTKKERHAAVRKIIKEIITAEGFKVTKKIKFGPRYYVAVGNKNKRRAIFKICLFTDSVDHLTNEKFSREILFLNYIHRARLPLLKDAAPRLYAFGIKPRAWYMREYLSGQTQNINGGNIRFKKNFFSRKNLAWLILLFTALQKIKSRELPNSFKHLLYPPDFTKHLWRYIKPHWRRIESYMKWPGVARLIKKEFKKYAPVYNTAPRVLAHQEPYAPHFLKVKKGFRFLDWENIGWSNPTHDIVTIWMRAHSQPDWQKEFYQQFKKHWRHYKKFDQLWTIDVFIQSVFNVISYHFYDDKKDLISLVKFSDKKIREILTNNFKLYF